jgi:hypothetical protein
MREEVMSVWPLSTTEGQLLSVSICVEPNALESLLEALARVSFPINPQIYHDAAVVYRYPDDREETEAITLVEFPAYEARLPEVRDALSAYGFDSSSIIAIDMLTEIQSPIHLEPTPPGAEYVSRYRVKHRAAVA